MMEYMSPVFPVFHSFQGLALENIKLFDWFINTCHLYVAFPSHQICDGIFDSPLAKHHETRGPLEPNFQFSHYSNNELVLYTNN